MTPSLVPLYLRSRRLPGTAAALAVLFAVSRWGADRLVDRPFFESGARVPMVVLVPVLVAAVTGLSLHSRSGELDRSAPLPWWRWRGAHLLALTGLAVLWLGTALPGDPAHFGAPTLVRGVLGFTGLAAAGAALLGARLSWLPPVVYGGTVYLAAPRTPGGAAAVWAWSMQPGAQPAAWATAVLLFAAGAALVAVRGPAADGAR
ncbi:hypothetical protein [Actinacidiphila glaucinigra]|uniref:hypothetical protein n=1 Tax=Actinacidiphila glaucinigra TaxID=235986 RepID=UPI002E328216|nr:hypothetical protein [Actinacidiphila glaucinigra]